MPLRRSRALIITSLAVAAIACSATDSLEPGTPVAVTRLNSQPYPFLYYSQLRQPERLVVRDRAAWVAAWSSLWPDGAPIAAPPTVDFTKDMIVLTALGQRNSGGYSILIDSARATRNALIVFVGTTSPGPHCGATLALTQPVDIARLPRGDAAVSFVDVPSVTECR